MAQGRSGAKALGHEGFKLSRRAQGKRAYHKNPLPGGDWGGF